MNTYRGKGVREPAVVVAGGTAVGGNLAMWSSNDVTDITDGSECCGVFIDDGAAGENVVVDRSDCIIDVKADTGVALAQGAKCYATGSTAAYQGKTMPVVDAGAAGNVSVGVVFGADISAGGYGKMKVTPGDIYATTTIAGS